MEIFGSNILPKSFFCCVFSGVTGLGVRQYWDGTHSAGLNSPGCCSGAGSLPCLPVFSHAIAGKSRASNLPLQSTSFKELPFPV